MNLNQTLLELVFYFLDHIPIYSVRVKVKNLGSTSGEGASKKIAEMDAALNLYKKI